MVDFWIPKHAKDDVYWLAGKSVKTYFIGKTGSNSQQWVKYNVYDNDAFAGVIHLHDTKNNVKAIRFKTTDSSQYGTNVITKDSKQSNKIRLVEIAIKHFYKENSLTKAAVRFTKKLGDSATFKSTA